VQALHGKMAGAPGNAWLADLRQMILMSIFVPMFCVLAPRVRMWKLAERFYRIGVILALYNGTMGLLILMGLLDRQSEYAPFFAGDDVLAMMFVFVLIRSIILNKRSLLLLGVLTYGIVTPLNKPALAVFVFAIFVVFVAILFFRRRFETVVYKKAVKALFVLAVLFAVYALWLGTIGGGAAKQWLAERFLKTKVATFERDITAGRFAAYQWGIDQWKQHPFFGTGFGVNIIHFTKESKTVTMPVHNTPITILYQTGLTGFLLCFVIFLIWLRRMYNYFQECTDAMEMWPLLGMFVWSMTMVFSTLLGQTLGINNIGFLFWMCVAFLSNAETQNYQSRIEEDMSQQDVYEERLSVA
jgi:O-Antigen ligase.